MVSPRLMSGIGSFFEWAHREMPAISHDLKTDDEKALAELMRRIGYVPDSELLSDAGRAGCAGMRGHKKEFLRYAEWANENVLNDLKIYIDQREWDLSDEATTTVTGKTRETRASPRAIATSVRRGMRAREPGPPEDEYLGGGVRAGSRKIKEPRHPYAEPFVDQTRSKDLPAESPLLGSW